MSGFLTVRLYHCLTIAAARRMREEMVSKGRGTAHVPFSLVIFLWLSISFHYGKEMLI